MNNDEIIAKFLMTKEGKNKLRKVMFHGYSTFNEAIWKYYRPRLIARRRGWKIIDGGK